MLRDHRVCAVALAASALVPMAALAQNHPIFLPTRSVAVTYSLTSGSEPPQTTHLYFSAEANKLRIDTPGNGGFTVLDRNAGRRLMVMSPDRAYAAVPLDPGMADGFVLNSTMTYKRIGDDTVNGMACTKWTVSSPGTKGTACVTADGVLLSGNGTQQDGSQTGLVATSVQYATQSDSLFVPPSGYHLLDQRELEQMQGPEPGAGGPGGPSQAPGQEGAGGPPPGQP